MLVSVKLIVSMTMKLCSLPSQAAVWPISFENCQRVSTPNSADPPTTNSLGLIAYWAPMPSKEVQMTALYPPPEANYRDLPWHECSCASEKPASLSWMSQVVTLTQRLKLNFSKISSDFARERRRFLSHTGSIRSELPIGSWFLSKVEFRNSAHIMN